MTGSPRIQIKGRDIVVSRAGPLGPGDVHRFLNRAFAHSETASVRVEHEKSRFSIALLPGGKDPRDSLRRLAELMVQPVPETSLPEAPEVAQVTYRRWRGIVTLLPLTDQTLGEVRIPVSRSARRSHSAASLQRIRSLPGVHRVSSRRLGSRIDIGYDPSVDPTPWIRQLEQTLYPPAHGLVPVRVPESSSLMSNTNLVLCTTGQFFYPPAIPLVSGILLFSRIPQLTKAGKELFGGKIGTPFYGSVVVLCSVASMAPFASALAEWLTGVWERRATKQIRRETHLLLDTAPIKPSIAAPGETLKPVQLAAGQFVPFDGTVTKGDFLVRDALFRDPAEAPLERKRAGDRLDAGYLILAGSGTLSPKGYTGDDRLTAAMRVISNLPLQLSEDPVLHAESRSIGDLSVYPNLAISTLAYMNGGLHMAGAVLHQDWTAVPAIAAPTEFFKDLRTALPYGVLVRSPGALKGLAATDVLLIEASYPGLFTPRPRVSDIESDAKTVSRANDWASVLAEWVGDDRSLALRDLARVSDHEVGTVSLESFEGGITTLVIDGVKVRLEDLDEGGLWHALRLHVDGESPETLRFSPTENPRFSKTLKKLRALGIATAVFGPKARDLPADVADALYPDLDAEGIAAFREDLKRQGYSSGIVLSHGSLPLDASGASVVIGPIESINGIKAPTIQLLGTNLDALPDLVLAARTLRLRTGVASLKTIPTNLLCILGAFAGRFNGTMTTLIAHAGVLGVSLVQGRRIRTAHRPILIPKEH